MNKEARLIDKIMTIVFIVVLVLFILSCSIFMPLMNRGFYYAQIDDLNIVETLNNYTREDYTKDDVIEAFDDVMDFIWKGSEFKTGKLKFSESGKSHFEDCVPLFWLDFIVFIITSILMITFLILNITKTVVIQDIKGMSALFYGGIITIGVVIILGIFGIISFDLLFEYFHKVFFPGKDNWVFNPRDDEVILILPEEFFMRCAILIGATLFVLSGSAIAYGVIKKKGKLV